jgi:hypothetical protein
MISSIRLVNAAPDFVAVQARDAGDRVDEASASSSQEGTANVVEDEDALEVLSDAEQAAALKRRGRANVLGMDLEEGPNHRATVVGVTAASPAFDAGIREGDVIVAFDGFAGKTYREWLDGIRRMVTDTPDGATVAVEVSRNGKRVVANIRTPESHADDPLLPNLLDPTQSQAAAPGTAPPAGQPANQPVGPNPGNDIFINNVPFNDAFGAGLSPVTERAMAEIALLGQQQHATSDSSAASAQPATPHRLNTVANPNLKQRRAASPAEGRIGVAGFRDTEEGMLVMVDVGGLSPGSYRVSVEDPAIVLDANTPEKPEATGPQSSGTQPNVSNPSRTGSTTPPTGRVNPNLTPPTGQVDRAAAPPTGRVLQPGAPATGRVLPSGTAAVGLPADDQRVSGAAGPAASTNATRSGSLDGTLSRMGVLTVDESGTGRLQQVVENIRVRDVVGLAIMIHATDQPPDTTSPATSRAAGPDGVQGAASQAQRSPASIRNSQPSALDPPPHQPIAAGMIRLLPDRRPAARTAEVPGTDVPPAEPQPGHSQPAPPDQPGRGEPPAAGQGSVTR